MSAAENPAEVGLATPVIVVRVGESPPSQYPGVVANIRASSLAVRTDDPVPLRTGECVLVIAVGSSPRLAVRCRFAAAQGPLCAFQLDGNWQALEAQRHDARYQPKITAEVRSVLGTSRQAGTLLDISTGGASVAVANRPGGRQVEIGLAIAGYSATLPGEVAGVTEADGLAVLHLRFGALSPTQHAFLRHVMGMASTSAEARGERAG